MKKQIDRILLGLLWLLAATLGTCFWFGTQFGFNIFSAQHWQYLAYIQATRQPVRPLFYISLTLCMVIGLGGLYIIMRPRLNKLNIVLTWKHRNKKTKKAAAPTAPATPAITTQSAPTPPVTASTIVIPPSGPAYQSAPADAPQRPARLSLSTGPAMQTRATTPIAPVAPIAPATHTATADKDYPQLREIFTNAGYIVKKPSKIGTLRPDLVAIGTDEVLWIGGVGISVDALNTVIDKLTDIFTDTLEDIEIKVNGFIVAPQPGPATNTDHNILTFADINTLGEFMETHKNPPAPDPENFDAYSQYIDTVLEYSGKI